MNLLTQLIPPAPTQVVEPKATLLDLLAPSAPAASGLGTIVPKPTRRGLRRRPRQTRADRQQRDETIAAEIRQKLVAWDREQARARSELLAKSARLPDGVAVVSGQEQGSGQDKAAR